MSAPVANCLLIVGVGLIGGSIGLAARRRGVAGRVVGAGRNRATLLRARELGAIDDVTDDFARAAADADLVVFCTPVDQIADQAAGAHARPGTLLTDAGSTKGEIARAVAGRLPPGVHFVGGHPLAGSEKRGPEAARADLFLGRVTVLTPTAETPPDALARLRAFWQALGSRTVEMSPDDHDRALALTSHLPHVAASALAGCLPAELLPLAASGFRDTTRVAAGDAEVWSAIFRANRPAVLLALDSYLKRLTAYRAALAEGDDEATARLWAEGKRVRDALGS